MPGRDKVPDMEGRRAAALIGVAHSDGDLEVSRSLLEQKRDHIRLETESVSIGMPAKDIVAQMHRAAIVVVDGITAEQIDQESIEFRYGDPDKTFSRKLFMERNNNVSLSHHFEDLN